MQKLKIILSALILSLILISCGNTAKEITKDQHGKEAQISQSDEKENSTIKLNQNEKWLINEEMKPFITDSESILIDYITQGTNDYKALATQLKENNSKLIKSCTMQGESHDELHKWLHQHMDLIAALEKAENIETAQQTVNQLKESFITFNTYFQ
jgi:hypothetical protein